MKRIYFKKLKIILNKMELLNELKNKNYNKINNENIKTFISSLLRIIDETKVYFNILKLIQADIEHNWSMNQCCNDISFKLSNNTNNRVLKLRETLVDFLNIVMDNVFIIILEQFI